MLKNLKGSKCGFRDANMQNVLMSESVLSVEVRNDPAVSTGPHLLGWQDVAHDPSGRKRSPRENAPGPKCATYGAGGVYPKICR